MDGLHFFLHWTHLYNYHWIIYNYHWIIYIDVTVAEYDLHIDMYTVLFAGDCGIPNKQALCFVHGNFRPLRPQRTSVTSAWAFWLWRQKWKECITVATGFGHVHVYFHIYQCLCSCLLIWIETQFPDPNPLVDLVGSAVHITTPGPWVSQPDKQVQQSSFGCNV